MNLNKVNSVNLKRIRVVLALCFLTFSTLAFFDVSQTALSRMFQFAVEMQFVPSLLKTIAIPGFIGIGLIATIILTFLFGRIYCSIICPLGIFQDIVSLISRKLKIKVRFRFKKGLPFLRYASLILILASVFLGVITILTFLDPFSFYGRGTSYLLKPLVVLMNNIGADGLAKADVYSLLNRSEFLAVSTQVFILNLILLTIVTAMSLSRGRLYCNTICPVGTLLGLIAKISLFKISLDESSCTKCGKCARVCKSECIDLANYKVDNSRCVACFNCLAICPEKATRYQFLKDNKLISPLITPKKNDLFSPAKIELSKRTFLLSSITGIASIVLFSKPLQAFAQHTGKKEGNVAEDKTEPISPPGSISVNRLNDLCTGCSMCISACPTKVLRPSFLEYGLIGVMQPYLDPERNFCEYDCIVCSKVCPTGALKLLTVDAKHLCQIGIAKYEIRKCIVETEGVKCTKCFDNCPAAAIKMIPYNALFIPEIIESDCIGCGECEYVCPARPSRAIHVIGNPVHQLAKKPKQDQHPKKGEEFPF